MVNGVFDELIHKSQGTQGQLKQIASSTIDSLNTELAKGMTGQKMNVSGVFRAASQGLAKSALEKTESIGLQALGLGKRDGSSAAAALFVQMAGGSGANAIVPGMSEIFGSSKQNVVGSSGAASPAIGAASKGLLGILNDSNFFSSLAGGKLFGGGAIFGHFASGGDAPAGVPVRVGEMGAEDAIFPAGARIIPHSQSASGGANLTIDARGTDPSLTRANFQRALQATHAQAVNDASRAAADRSRRTAQ